MTYPTLYKRGVKGEVRCWGMEFQEVSIGQVPVGQHRVVSGILSGSMTGSGWVSCKPKNIGRSNATTSSEQALAEIDNLYKIKRERGYFDDIAKIDDVIFTKVMLAHDWTKRKAKVAFEDIDTIQPKLDGIRCIARADGLWTRTGKPITSLPHIVAALAPVFEEAPDAIFDGELYNHALREDFNTITSIVRKAKPSSADTEKAERLIQYHVYDIVSEMSPANRMMVVFDMLHRCPECIQLVPTVKLASMDSMDAYYGDWIEEGYEGQMVRLHGGYEHKRSSTLLKRKEFITEEFKVLRVEEGRGNWSGCAKRFVFELEDGRECGAGVRGTQEKLGELWESGDTPDWATVRYFTRTPDGYPRFPVVVDFGFGARDD